MAQRKFYVVWVGREPGIYDNWDDCEQQVAMFPGARYKAFTSQTAATLAFRGSPDDQEAIVRAIADHNAATPPPGAVGLEELKERFPEINGNAIAVDGACSGNPGPMEYQGSTSAPASGSSISARLTEAPTMPPSISPWSTPWPCSTTATTRTHPYTPTRA